MSNVIKVGNLCIGDGFPKICAPIIETNQDDILKMAEIIYKSEADMAEWRVDFYKDFDNIDAVNTTLLRIKKILNQKPLLFTFRTAIEGGNIDIDYDKYCCLLSQAAINADMVDIEVYRSDDIAKLISFIKKSAVVVGSYHDFYHTPSVDNIIGKLKYMDALGADILKIAVMPESKIDVIRLMEASIMANELVCYKPVITMSMSSLGLLSRIAAQNTCSAVTFGCIGKPSAPGQIEVNELRKFMDMLNQIAYC